jgi:hypothetical protein
MDDAIEEQDALDVGSDYEITNAYEQGVSY